MTARKIQDDNPHAAQESVLSKLIQAAGAFYINEDHLKNEYYRRVFLAIVAFGYIDINQVIRFKNLLKKTTNRASQLLNAMEHKFARMMNEDIDSQEELSSLRKAILDIRYETEDLQPELTTALDLQCDFPFKNTDKYDSVAAEKKKKESFLIDFCRELDVLELVGFKQKEALILGSDGVIDFEFGTRYFLSIHILLEEMFEDPGSYQIVSGIMEQWLEFLARNDICKAYKQDIEKSIKIARLAVVEIPKVVQLSQLLPGKFNELYYNELVLKLNSGTKDNGFDTDEYYTFSEVFKNAKVLNNKCTDVAIKKVIPPFTVLAQELDRDKNLEVGPAFEIYFENDIIKHCIPNLIIECTLYTLNNGSRFLKSVTSVWPSYTPLDYGFDEF